LTSLTGLVLSHNQLSGSIPAEVCGGFTNPTHPESEYVQHHGLLDLSYNWLSGRIPPAIKNCVILEELHLQGNLLNGSVPAELGELKNIRIIDVSLNALDGPMFPWSAPLLTLQGLFLSNNHLNDIIPAEIGRILPNIAVLNLSSNAFMASLPPSLLCSKSLNHLDVSDNNLSGEILLSCPGYEESLCSLVFFNASSNHLSGSLDGSILNFRQLSTLDIHNNSLTGSLPSVLSNLSYLNYLDLSKNDFSGSSPCGVCNIFGITFANFSGNRIGMHSLSDCGAPGICALDSIEHKEGHPPHVILKAVTICAAVVIVILLVVYVGGKLSRKLSRRRPTLFEPLSSTEGLQLSSLQIIPPQALSS